MNMNNENNTNKRLLYARMEKNWTQKKLAEKLNVGISTVRSWEKATRYPSSEYRIELCRLFEKTPEELGLLPHAQAHFTTEPSRDVFVPPSLMGQEDENRSKMLKRIYVRCIAGALTSVSHETFIRLHLQLAPDAVASPWLLEKREISADYSFASMDVSISEVYDRVGGEFVILGEPGAGKTTLLLELTRDLLVRAEADERFPIPVIFHLSSWAEKQQHVVDWMIGELNTKYQVPPTLAHKWVMNDQVLPLLDGLDEVKPHLQVACVEAINAYRSMHGLVPVVVCSRLSDYRALSARLVVNQAVIVQPLTIQQIDAYVAKNSSEDLLPVQQSLHQDLMLQEMVSTPLMLNVLIVAAHEMPIEKLLVGDFAERRRRILATYVRRMLARRGSQRYTLQQTMRWLTWLALYMQKRNQTEFYLERIQPTWLPNTPISYRYQNTVRCIILLITGFVAEALFACFRGDSVPNGPGLFFWLGNKTFGNHILGWMAPGLGEQGLQGTASLSIIYTLVSLIVALLAQGKDIPTISIGALRQALWDSIRFGLPVSSIITLFAGAIFSHSVGLLHGFSHGVNIGIFSFLLCGWVVALNTLLLYARRQHQKIGQFQQRPRIRWRDRLYLFLSGGIGAATGFGCLFALQGSAVSLVFFDSFICGLFSGILYNLGLAFDIFPDVGVEIKPTEVSTWSVHNAWENLATLIKKGCIVGCTLMLSIMVVLIGASSLFHGIMYGVRYGVVFSLIAGLITYVAVILTGLLTRGWSSNMGDEREFMQPNEGIHRSIRNALFAACMCGSVGGIASGIVCGFAFGIVGHLTGWLILGSGFALICGCIFALVFALFHGGIAVLEHYTLRLYLWRAGCTPFHYVEFLNGAAESILLRKIGGGYMFSHQLLLEYFANPTGHE